MNALVTGGLGFIGSHLTRTLLDLGCNVTVLDNLSFGRKENLAGMESTTDGRLRLIIGDCKKTREVSRALRNVDTVFHFAAVPDVRFAESHGRQSLLENVYSTHVLLHEIAKKGTNTIVFASTSTVYGDAKLVPTPENYSPLQPISAYGREKLSSEALVLSYAQKYRKRALILRFANIVGAQSSRGVINDFIGKLKKNPRTLKVLGNGDQTKSYLHINDCVEAILGAHNTMNGNIEILNVGSEDQTRVGRIAEIVIEEMGLQNVRTIFSGGVDGGRGWPGDVKNMLLDVSQLKSRGWAPNHNSEAAIRLATRSTLEDGYSRQPALENRRGPENPLS